MQLLVQYQPLVLQFGVVLPHQVATNVGLEEAHDFCETLITKLLKITEHTGAEEHFGMAKTVLVLFELQGTQYLLSHDLAINKSLGDGVRGQDRISVMYNRQSHIATRII